MSCSNETLNDLRWKISEYQVWSSQQDLQLLHSSFSHLRKFYQTLVTNSWISYRLSKTMSHTCEIWTTFCSNFLKWKNGLYKDCRSWIHDHDSMRPMKQCAWLFLLMPRRLVLIWCLMYDVSVSLSYLLLYSLVFRLNLDGLWTHRVV